MLLKLTEKSDPTDEALVEAAASGDVAAFEMLDRRYRERLTRFLTQRAGDWHHGEELAQRTMARAFEALGTLRDSDRWAAWIYRIGVRFLIDDKRKTERQKTVPLDDTNPLSGALEPEQLVLRRERRDNLWDLARNSLTPDEFGALWLRYVEELSDREIAKVLGKSHGAVRVLQHRARRRLAEVLDENGNWRDG